MKNFTSYVLLLLLTASGYLASGSTIYSQNFSGGIPGTWRNLDSASSGVVWHATTTGTANNLPFTHALDTTGTTAANGYVIFDSDSACLAGDGWLITPAINCTGKSNVHLSFNEYFVQWNVSKATVLVSNDNVNWTAVHSADAGLTQDQGTANPNAVDLNIAALADNKATVYVAFHYVGGCEYFWMVDDVILHDVPTIDGGVAMIDTPMTSCNFAFTTNVTVTIQNFGADTIMSSPVSYSINGGGPVNETCPSAIPPGGNVMFTFTTPGALMPGINSIKAYSSIPSDINALNDTSVMIIYNGPHPVIGSYVYTDGFETAMDTTGWKAWDANSSGTTWAIGIVQPNSGSQYANLDEANADDWYFSTCLALEQTPIDSAYDLTFYYRTFSPSYDADMEVRLFASQDTNITVKTIVPLQTVTYTSAYSQSSTLFPIALSGVYYLGFHGKHHSLPTSLEIDDINLQLVLATGLNPVASKNTGVVLYPNPNTGMFYLANLRSLNGPVQVNVFDMMGNAVYSQIMNEDRAAIDLASQPAGVYMVRLNSQTDVVTKMVTITR